MIIKCDHCSAKFRIDDAKLANGPVKVRCAKCKEVFVVDQTLPETVQMPETDGSPQPTAPESADEGFGFSFDQEQPPESAAATRPPPADEFDWKDTSVNESSAESDNFPPSEGGASAGSFQDQQTSSKGDASDFDFGEIDLQASPAGSHPPAQPAPGDDFSLDFGEVSFAEPSQPSSENAAPPAGEMTNDFSFDVKPASAPSSATAAASDDFLLSFDTAPLDKPKTSASSEGADEKVNFGDFSFGEETNDGSVERPGNKEPLPKLDLQSFSDPSVEFSDEEPVPTSLPSRKKNGSRFPFILILGAIVIIAALAGSGLYFFGGSKAFSKVGLGFLVDWYGDKGSEEGSITIRNIQSSYVVNSSSGELFVVRGEAVNNYKKPRASVQVKVSVLGAGGAVIAGKTAFCGNSLSNEQLSSLPVAKIEETMNNRFGDSLTNLGVKPGSAIPFVVAIQSVPKEAVDFSVQVVGSTVATQ
jgi:predicted Zn finger-like uncharacterized protein